MCLYIYIYMRIPHTSTSNQLTPARDKRNFTKGTSIPPPPRAIMEAKTSPHTLHLSQRSYNAIHEGILQLIQQLPDSCTYKSTNHVTQLFS